MSPTSWKEFQFDQFNGGYSSDLDPEMLPKHFITQGSNNVQYNRALLSKRDGRQLFGPNAPFTGTCSGLWVFQLANGTAFLLAITTSKLYRYVVASQTWVDITPGGGLNGTTTFAPQFITYNDFVYITNGVDPIIRWDGLAATASFITGSGAPTACDSLAVFAGFLFAIRPTVGSQFGWRIMWSNFNDPTVFNAGQAGAVDLNDTPEIVLTAYVVGRYLSIYKTNTIYETVFVGPPVFFDFRRIDTPGISLRRSLVNILVLGLFGFGRDDAYIFDQNQSRPIGKPVRQEILGTINWNAADTANAWFRPDVGRVYLNIPTGNSTLPNKVWAYSYVDGQWMPEADYQVLAGTFAEITSNLLVSQLTSPISSYTMTIDQLTRLNQRQALVTDGTNVFYLAPVGNDYVTPTAAAISSNFVTAEVPLEVQNGKPVPAYVGEVLVIGNAIPGNLSVTVNASTGDGIYNSVGPIAVSMTNAMRVPVPVEIYGERFSAQIANNTVNESFAVKQLVLRYRTRAGRV